MNAAQPAPCIGVLALQGAFTAHEDALRSLHVITRQVRTPADLTQVAALVMPGGESTTMARLLETSQMFDELSARISAGMPVFGTCAGMILLAKEVLDGTRRALYRILAEDAPEERGEA